MHNQLVDFQVSGDEMDHNNHDLDQELDESLNRKLDNTTTVTRQ